MELKLLIRGSITFTLRIYYFDFGYRFLSVKMIVILYRPAKIMFGVNVNYVAFVSFVNTDAYPRLILSVY